MITEEQYLEAKKIVQEYEKQLNISDVIKSVCDQTYPYWGYQCNINRMFEECKKNK